MSDSETPVNKVNDTECVLSRLHLECRPQTIYGAVYDRLPFPQLAPIQEIAFDLGVTAQGADYDLNGLVLRGYAGHQVLFEQRWPERFIRQRTGLDDTHIPEGTGIALRGMHIQMHAYDLLTTLEMTVVGAPSGQTESRESEQFQLRVPITFPQQQTDLHFPLAGTWWTVQASDWSDIHKGDVLSQPFAMDFVKLGEDSRFFRGSGATMEEHESWNQPVYAAAGGKIAYLIFDMPDLPPGTLPDPLIFRDDPRRLLGNAVAISHANGEFSYYAHLQQASMPVRYGDMVRRGDLIGRVGNSGQSPGPHLHFHLMTGPNLQIDQGIPCKLSHFEAGGQFFTEPISIPTRMIVHGPEREPKPSAEQMRHNGS